MKLNEPKQNELDRQPKHPQNSRRDLILKLRDEGRTFEEIAHRFGISHQRVQQIIRPKVYVPKPRKPKEAKVERQPQYSKTKGGILLKHKDYIDYLKESDYRESYKKFCIDNWRLYKRENMFEGDSILRNNKDN